MTQNSKRPAREDAQLEYRCPKCGAHADERYDCCEVYTHPVAVEALESINRIRSEMVGVPVDSEAANAWALALDTAADHATQALAALQKENSK